MFKNGSIFLHNKDGEGNTKFNPSTIDYQVAISSKNSAISEDVTDLLDLIDNLGELAFADSVDIPTASDTTYGVVKTTNDIESSEDETMIPTVAAIKNYVLAQLNAFQQDSNVSLSGDNTFTGNVTFQNPVNICNYMLGPKSYDQDGETKEAFCVYEEGAPETLD